ncbi:MAG: hypothetical protein WBB67_01415 [bacterium]
MMVNLIATFIILSQFQSVVVHFFYVPDCGHCMNILLDELPKLQSKYKFKLHKYNIDIMDNYRLLEKMEENVENVGDDLPVVFIADSVFYGPEQTRAKLEPTIKMYAKTIKPVLIKDTIKATAATIPADTVDQISNEIHLYYFYQPGCPGCERAEIVLAHGQQLYSQLIVHKYNILDDSNKVFFEALAQKLSIPEEKRLVVPGIIIGRDHLTKREINLALLDSLVIKYKQGCSEYTGLNLGSAEKNIIERFARFSIFGIIFAGLLDGVNPCAFATLIFFVSYLLFIGRRRRDVIIMSIFFILAVFISYFAIGFGAYNLLKHLSGYALVSKIIFLCFGTIALVLGVLSLRDYFFARQGKLNKMILQLPLGIKQRIHKGIKEKTAVGSIIIGSLIAGFLISYLEFGCTGQVYLPTITFMVSKAGIALKPLVSLFIYNLMFILPLVVIAVLASLFTTKNIAKSLETKIPAIKLFTALLFFALGILLILSA